MRGFGLLENVTGATQIRSGALTSKSGQVLGPDANLRERASGRVGLNLGCHCAEYIERGHHRNRAQSSDSVAKARRMICQLRRFALGVAFCCYTLSAAVAAEPTKNDASESTAASPAAQDPCAGLDASKSIGSRGAMIVRVEPATFSEGDRVTLCGRGLGTVQLMDNYELRDGAALEAGEFIEIGDETARKGWKVMVFGVTRSLAGDRMAFTIGGLYENVLRPDPPSPFVKQVHRLVSAGQPGARPTPARVQGEIKLMLNRGIYGPPKTTGPSVTWLPGGPKVQRAYGGFFGKQEPFVITPQGPGPVISNWIGLVAIEGGNLDGADFQLGDVKLTRRMQSGDAATLALVYVPPNASAGAVCSTGAATRSCSGKLDVQRGPVFTSAPKMPLQVRTRYVIEGTDLKPTLSGITYQLAMSGLSGESECAQVLNILEHSMTRIVFSLGDLADTTPLPPRCLTAPNYKLPQENSDNFIYLMARFRNVLRPVQKVYYYLSKESGAGDASPP